MWFSINGLFWLVQSIKLLFRHIQNISHRSSKILQGHTLGKIATPYNQHIMERRAASGRRDQALSVNIEKNAQILIPRK